MKTTTLFVLGLALGAAMVFGVRATSLDKREPGEAGQTHESGGHEGHETSEGESPGGEEEGSLAGASVEVRLDAMGHIEDLRMVMADGTSHPLKPGGHAKMGDYPARVEDRPGTFSVHLHPVSASVLEVILRDEAGDVVVRENVEAEIPDAPSGDDRPPENEICPVMGNAVDPEIYVDFVGRRIGFCCQGCDDVFLKDPQTYLKKVDAELAKKRGEK